MKKCLKGKRTLINKRDNQLVGLVFVLPFLIGFLLIFSKMLYDGFHAAFSITELGSTGMTYTFTGFSNFYYALRVDPLFIQRALEDLKSLLVTIPLVMIFSLFMAVVLNNDIWGRTFFRVIFFLPVIVSTGLLTKLGFRQCRNVCNVCGRRGNSERIGCGEYR